MDSTGLNPHVTSEPCVVADWCGLRGYHLHGPDEQVYFSYDEYKEAMEASPTSPLPVWSARNASPPDSSDALLQVTVILFADHPNPRIKNKQFQLIFNPEVACEFDVPGTTLFLRTLPDGRIEQIDNAHVGNLKMQMWKLIGWWQRVS